MKLCYMLVCLVSRYSPHALAVTQTIARKDSIGSQDGKQEKGGRNDKNSEARLFMSEGSEASGLSIACNTQRRWANLTRQAKRLTLTTMLTC